MLPSHQVTQIACDRDTTAALTLSSRVFVWGRALVQNPYDVAEEPDPEQAASIISAVVGDHDTPTELPVLLQALQVLAAHKAQEVRDVAAGKSPRRKSGGVRASGELPAAVVGVAQSQLSDYLSGVRYCPPQPGRLHITRIAIGCGGATLLAGLSSCTKPRPQVKVLRRLNTLRAMSKWANGGVAGLLRSAKGESSTPSAVLRKALSSKGDLLAPAGVAAATALAPESARGGSFGFGASQEVLPVAVPQRQARSPGRVAPRLPRGSFNAFYAPSSTAVPQTPSHRETRPAAWSLQ